MNKLCEGISNMVTKAPISSAKKIIRNSKKGKLPQKVMIHISNNLKCGITQQLECKKRETI